ncbi:MAG: signal recognition particle-docking protein FtsY, partial [Thermoguttaceae bacterium]|nr:signal recognition particle-docking protein FtsY [Thermoguttaceae bacterium]
MNFFGKIKEGLKKTLKVLNTDVRDLFKSEGQLVDDDFCEKLFDTLIKTDMGVEAAQGAVDAIKKQFRGRVVQQQ